MKLARSKMARRRIYVASVVLLLLSALAGAESQGPPAGLQGQVEVTNFPEIQDVFVINAPESNEVLVTNPASNPVRVEVRNTREGDLWGAVFNAPAGESDGLEFGQTLNAFFVHVAGADSDMSVVLKRQSGFVLLVRGAGAGGQHSYSIPLGHLLPVDGIEILCHESSASCQAGVWVTGY